MRRTKDREFNGKLRKLALPIAFQNLMLALVATADALMLGSIEQNSMSAVSLATQIQFVQNMILISIVGASSMLGAQYWGKKDSRAMDDIFLITLRAAAVVSALTCAGCVFASRPLMRLFTDDEELIMIGAGYLRIAGWSYLLTGVSQAYLAMMKVTEHASAAAKISTVTVLLNIALNAVFIFGFLGRGPRGAQGAAAATLLSRVAELGTCVVISFRDGYLRPRFRLFRINRLLVKDYCRCLVPLLGASLLWSIGFAAYPSFMGHINTDAAAANSVAAVIRDLICCLCNGLGSGGSILVGNELGAGRLDTGKLYGDRLAVLSFLCGFASTVIMLILTPIVTAFVDLTGTAREYLIRMMIIMSVYMIGRAVNTVVINGIFYAGGDNMFDFYSLIVCMWCLAVPLAALGTYVFHWPVWIVYACTCLDEVGKIPWVMAHYRKYKWVRNLTRENINM